MKGIKMGRGSKGGFFVTESENHSKDSDQQKAIEDFEDIKVKDIKFTRFGIMDI